MNADILFSLKPTFDTQRLYLRKLEITDAEEYFDFACDPLITEHVRWDYHKSLDDSVDFLIALNQRFEARLSFNWGIIDRVSSKLIGRICLFGFEGDYDSAEIGYMVSRNYWNQGIVTEACNEIIKYGFLKLELNRIEARCNEGNIGSEKVMQKIGMTFEGILREQLKIKNEYKSQKLYSILKREFLSKLNEVSSFR